MTESKIEELNQFYYGTRSRQLVLRVSRTLGLENDNLTLGKLNVYATYVELRIIIL